MKIKVTQEHIDLGCIRNVTSCPIARAVMEIIPGKLIAVHPEYISICDGLDEPWIKYPIPTIASNFIELFDVHLPVHPFEFECEGLEAEVPHV